MVDLLNATLADDVTMPLLGFGTWQLRGREAYDSTRAALEIGYRHIDTATMYANEEEVGRAIQDSGVSREDIFVTTKLRPGDSRSEREVIAASLRLMKVDYVDLWLIHSPPGPRQLVPMWREFLKIRDSGLIKAAGVSNYRLAQIDELIEATGEAPAVNQIPWSPADHDAGVLDGHGERGVLLEGYSPLKRTDLRSPVLAEIAARHDATPAQVVLRWHLEHGIAVIPKSAHRDRIAANFDLARFSLTPEEVAQVDAL